MPMSSIRPGVCITQNQPGTSLMRELMTEFFDKIKTPLPNNVMMQTLETMMNQAATPAISNSISDAIIQLEMTGRIAPSLYQEVKSKVVEDSVCDLMSKFGSNIQSCVVGHKLDERTLAYVEHQCRTMVSALNQELKKEGSVFGVELHSVTNDNGNIKFNVNMSSYPNTAAAISVSTNEIDPAWNVDNKSEMYIEDEELETPRDNLIRSDAPWRAE